MHDEHPTPQSTVMAWWLSMQTRNLQALEQLALPDYISAGGPMGRTVGRHVMLAQAKEFLATSSIEEWAVSDLELRRHDDVCVCSYHWTERGLHDDEAFDIGGVATDVLVRRDGRWLYQSHHVG